MRACVLLLLLGQTGCIRAPDLVIVDHKTALEEQAGGSYRGLAEDLDGAAVSPRPAPFTRGELESAGVAARPGEVLAENELTVSDVDQIDRLLVRRCLGEKLNGTLAVTPQSCTERRDAAEVSALVERANRTRWQVWRMLQERHPGAKPDEVRRAWRNAHMSAVICGAQVENADGTWGVKKC